MLLAAASAEAAPTDPRVRRGLDFYAQGPKSAAAGTSFPLEVLAYGFPEVTKLLPLSGARVEARWDPESVGEDLPSAVLTSGADGRAVLTMNMPEGPSGSLSLLLSISLGGKSRTRSLSINRHIQTALSLGVSEREVVPGGRVTAWVSAQDSKTQSPLRGVPIEIELREGGLARVHQEYRSDEAGSVVASIPVPYTEEVAWQYTLHARIIEGKERGATAWATLSVRHETPSRPQMQAAFDLSRVRAGDPVVGRVRIKDAAGRPLAAAPLRYWIGPRGAEPKPDTWLKLSREGMTGSGGELVLTSTAPTTISARGAAVVLLAEAQQDGYELKTSAEAQVGALEPTLDLIPEAGQLVPGSSQRLLLRALDAEGAPIVAEFELDGDHLKTTVRTDRFGEAELRWDVPSQLGADHPSGPCAGWVAATVLIRPKGPAIQKLGDKERHSRCVQIDASALFVVPERPTVRAGEKLRLEVLGAKGKRFSLLTGDRFGPWPITVLDQGKGEVLIPRQASGVIDLDVYSAGTKGAALRASGHVLVIPRVLPRLSITQIGGRLAPGGEIVLDVALTDENGRGLPGKLSGHVIDRFGGGRVSVLSEDTRHALTSRLSLGPSDEARADGFFDGDRSKDPWRRAALAELQRAPAEPWFDPAKDAEEQFEATFKSIVRSLEGAVFESTASPDKLENARRKTAQGYELNPELLTLVTAAMGEVPETPGGEPIELGDLVNLDGAVRFDRVARRVTRLKLFRVLDAVREHVYAHRLYPDELALKEPGSILRRLVREGTLDPSMLLDPWGGTLQFVRSDALDVPYLAVVRRFRLVSPGPDGRVGTTDDVVDPFERVLASDTPYARAVDEDRLVDARYEVVVGDETVTAWRSLFEELTGSVFGQSAGLGGLGTRGYGAGGGGAVRSGQASVGARGSSGRSAGVGIWIPPQRTDAQGKLQIRIPLPDLETTYSIGLIATPDDGPTAATTAEVAVALPLSVRVEAGTAWSEKDALSAEVVVRNRSAQPITAALKASARGSIALAGAAPSSVRVPADGSTTVLLPLKAVGPGDATIEVEVSAPGLPTDRVAHRLEVRPEAERVTRWAGAWVDGERILELPALAEGDRPAGLSAVEVERGVGQMVRRGLGSLDPDRLGSLEAELEAIGAVRAAIRWAEKAEPAMLPEAERTLSAAIARAIAFRELRPGKPSGLLDHRLRGLALERAPSAVEKATGCPDSSAAPAAVLEAEPHPDKDGVLACWDVAVALAVGALDRENRPADLARGLLALVSRPHRRSYAAQVVDRLRERWLSADRSELRVLSAGDRQGRALMAAALLRASKLGEKPSMAPERLLGHLAELQDPSGGFGSVVATRAAIEALAGSGLVDQAEVSATVDDRQDHRLELPVAAGQRRRVLFGRDTTAVKLVTTGPTLAKISQPIWRSWWRPVLAQDPAFGARATWPVKAELGRSAILHLEVRNPWANSELVELRLPLPPGAHLAEESPGAIEREGILIVQLTAPGSTVNTVLDVPLRFRLLGELTAPEGRARILDGEGPRVPVGAARIRVVPRSIEARPKPDAKGDNPRSRKP